MFRYWTLVTILLLIFLGLFFLFKEVELAPLIQQPQPLMVTHSIGTASVGIGLLVADVVLPVPSSLVMVTHGALFGIWWGTILSAIGGLGATLVGFAVGRCGGPLLARFVPLEEQTRVEQMLAKWGLLAIILTRPVPLLAETIAVVAGASSLRWSGVAAASLTGILPTALLYAITGATAMALNSAWLTAGLVIAVAGLFYIFEQKLSVTRTQFPH